MNEKTGFYHTRLTRPKPSAAWSIAKYLFRASIRWRSRFPFALIPWLFTAKEQILNDAMAFVEFNQVRGDYLEFGTYEGNAFLMAFHLAQGYRMDGMRFYAFDSFEGLPEIEGVDGTAGNTMFEKGEFACSLSAFQGNLRRHGVDPAKTRIVPGFFDRTLTAETKRSLPLKAAAVVLIDCDLYSSARQVLDFLTDYVVNGTVLIFDDWLNFKADPRHGERRAFDEWLEKNPVFRATEFHKVSWHGNSFIINKAE